MKETRTFELAQALETGKMYLIDGEQAYWIKGYYYEEGPMVTNRMLESALDKAIPNFHNLTSIDNVSSDSITVTYNVRGVRRL